MLAGSDEQARSATAYALHNNAMRAWLASKIIVHELTLRLVPTARCFEPGSAEKCNISQGHIVYTSHKCSHVLNTSQCGNTRFGRSLRIQTLRI